MLQVSRRTIDWSTFLLVVLACGWALSLPLRSHGNLLGFAQDDFYYYLKPAQNLVNLHVPTFDGITATNGFQPLYFVFLAVVSLFTQRLRAVFEVLWVLDVMSVAAVFVLVRGIFYRRLLNPWISNAFAVVVAMFSVRTTSMQMEVTLALPLGFAFLSAAFVPPERYTARRSAVIGLLAALAMLARLDAAFLPALFVLGLWLVPACRRVFTAANVSSFLAAALPLPLIYFAINLRYFHEVLPVSGAAKQLRHGWTPSIELLTSFHGFSVVILVLSVVCGVLAWRLRRQLRPEDKVFCFAAICAGYVFFAIEMFLSDWKLWGWYFYVLRFALAACLLIVGVVVTDDLIPPRWGELKRIAALPQSAPIVYVLSLLVLLGTRYRQDVIMLDIQDAAMRLQAFADTHPGRYAMGDRGGMFGYVSRSPVLQAEGLMMDREYLKHIRAEEDLRTVLLSYGVKYYVAFRLQTHETPGPCFHATEPVIAGKTALRMQTDLCQAPMYSFTGLDGTYRVFQLQ